MNKDLITHVSNAIMLALLVGIPVWFTFFPRRYERSWPSVLKPLLAIPCTVGAIYEFRYTLYYASSVAHTKTDPTTIFGSPPLFGFIIHALVIGIPVWFIFFSPRDERSWPSVLRRLLAITCAVAAIYGFLFTLAYAAILAYLRTDPPAILDGPTLILSRRAWEPVTIVSSLLFVSRLCFVALCRSNRHDTSPATTRNA